MNLVLDKKGFEVSCFGAHYDEARLTRYMCGIPEWVRLSEKAIPGYRELEQRTGIKFYEEKGCIIVDKKNGAFFNDNIASVEYLNLTIKRPSPQEARKLFPCMHTSDEDDIAIETRGAGYINPRKMILAEQTAAHLQGCDIYRDIVREIKKTRTDVGDVFLINTGKLEGEIRAKRVLLATGAFTEFYRLLPDGVKPEWDLVTHTIIFAELGLEDTKRMTGLPPMVYNGEACRRASGERAYDGWGMYLLPPIKYPDGKVYLKLGHHYMSSLHSVVYTREEAADWYRGHGSKEAISWLTKVMYYLFPGIQPVSLHSGTCLLVHTPSHRPYISSIQPHFTVALGGNGMAAKSCDQIRKIAVDLAHCGSWPSNLAKDAFRFQASSSHGSKL